MRTCFSVMLVNMVLACPFAMADDVSMPGEQFFSLSSPDQKITLLAALHFRLDRSKNVLYDVDVELFNHRVDELNYTCDLTIRDVHNSGYLRNFRHWRLGDSYRMEMVHRWKDDRAVGQKVINSFDSKAGIHKGMVHLVTKPGKVEGGINTEQDIVDQTNRYLYWLDGQDNKIGQYLIRHLADHLDDAVISRVAGSELISLTHPWANSDESKPLGSRTVIIDPAKGFLPVRSTGTKIDADTKKEVWFEAFDVLDSRLIKDLWMPTRLREVCSNQLRDPEHEAAVYNVTIRAIDLDCVKPADLPFVFPVSTSVVDNIKGIAYITGPGELPAGKVHELLGGQSVTSQNPNPPARGYWTTSMVVINVGVVLIIASVVVRRKFGGVHRKM